LLNDRLNAFSYFLRTSPVYVAVFLMRFAFAFTVVAIQYIVPIPYERGVISAAYPLAEMLTGAFFGVLADRIGRKWLVSGALLASSAITLSFTFTRSFELLVFIHGLQGLCAAAIVTSTLASLADFAKKETRGREMGLYDFCTIGGYGLGFVFSLLIIGGNSANAQIPFYVGAVFALIGAIYSVLFLKDEKVKVSIDVSYRAMFSQVISSRKSLSLLATWFVLTIIIGLGLTYTRELFSAIISLKGLGIVGVTRAVSGQPTKIGLVAALLLIVGVVLLGFSQTSLGSLADKYGRSRLVLIGQVSIFGILVTLVLLFQIHSYSFLAIPFLLLFGAGLLAFTPAGLAELSEIAPQSGRGSTMGLYSVVVGAGTVFAPLAGGYFISKYGPADGFSIVYSIGIVIMTVVLLSHLSEKK
jgi:ACDE family multidrug resistance protein